MKTLHLNVKKEFFDMIKSGEKKEEYREVKPYWSTRLLTRCNPIDAHIYFNDMYYKPTKYDYVQFKNGYQKNASTLLIECKGIKIGKPNPNWIGKQFDGKDDVFIIELGDINEVKNG